MFRGLEPAAEAAPGDSSPALSANAHTARLEPPAWERVQPNSTGLVRRKNFLFKTVT